MVYVYQYQTKQTSRQEILLKLKKKRKFHNKGPIILGDLTIKNVYALNKSLQNAKTKMTESKGEQINSTITVENLNIPLNNSWKKKNQWNIENELYN